MPEGALEAVARNSSSCPVTCLASLKLSSCQPDPRLQSARGPQIDQGGYPNAVASYHHYTGLPASGQIPDVELVLAASACPVRRNRDVQNVPPKCLWSESRQARDRRHALISRPSWNRLARAGRLSESRSGRHYALLLSVNWAHSQMRPSRRSRSLPDRQPHVQGMAYPRAWRSLVVTNFSTSALGNGASTGN